MTGNQINFAKMQEDRRHNLEMEAYNRRMASTAEANAATNYSNMLVGASQVQVNAASVAESQRHNAVTEQQQSQHLVNEAVGTGSGAVGKVGDWIFKIVGLFT